MQRHKNECPPGEGGQSPVKIAAFVYPLWASQESLRRNARRVPARRTQTTLKEVDYLHRLVETISAQQEDVDLLIRLKKLHLELCLELLQRQEEENEQQQVYLHDPEAYPRLRELSYQRNLPSYQNSVKQYFKLLAKESVNSF